jgi:opacity protein-like surface antigen
VFGVGGEYGITQNWWIKAEYDWLDFGSQPMTFYRCGTCTANGVPGGAADEDLDVKPRVRLFKVGVNYRFWV